MYYTKEFYNRVISSVFAITLLIFAFTYAAFSRDGEYWDGVYIYMFIQPAIYYVVLFCLHAFDADRDNHPTPKTVIVNDDALEMYYIVK